MPSKGHIGQRSKCNQPQGDQYTSQRIKNDQQYPKEPEGQQSMHEMQL